MAATDPIRFKRFDPSTIRDYASILFAGGKRTGKSSVMREFLWFLKDRVYDGHVFTGTYDDEHPWANYFPPDMVHNCMKEFDAEGLDRVLDTQLKRVELARKHSAKCPASICVFEDLEFLKPSIWINQGIRGAIFNGRWYKEFFFVAYQYIMEIRAEMRGSFDYAVFTMDASRAVRERIWKQFAGIFPTLDAFESAFVELTKDYRVMVIDLRVRSYKIEDCIFWYRSNPNLGFFHVGHPDAWAVRPAAAAAGGCASAFSLRAAAPKQAKYVLVDENSLKKKKLAVVTNKRKKPK